MNLISCHILGFGKFVNASFDFSKPLVVFKENNGWGKTTLADFIECMLFGLEGSRSKSVTENYRLKYAPWSGSGFGGSLTFFYRGQTYRVERIFGRTAGADVVKIYNQNHAPCYDFGEKGERLGEILFGLERESYRKIAYLSQGGNGVSPFPESLKARLISLLGESDNGQSRGALERLDTAERALRAKRKPGKGKLDLLDERIEELSRAVDEGKRAQERALEMQTRAQALKGELLSLTQESERISAELNASQDGAESELRGKLAEREAELAELQDFFGDADAATLNVEGLEKAVTEFYQLVEKREEMQIGEELAEAEKQEIERLKTQISAKEQAIETYQLLLQEKEETKGAGLRSKQQIAKKSGFGGLMIALGVAVLSIGISQWTSKPALASSLVTGGGIAAILGLLTILLPLLFQRNEAKKSQNGTASVKRRIAEAERDLEDLKLELSALVQSRQKQTEAQREALEQAARRRQALEKGIVEFLSHFRIPKSYDYRASLQILKEKKSAHERCAQRVEQYRLEQRERLHTQNAVWSGDSLAEQKRRLDGERESKLDERANALADLAELERLQRTGEAYAGELEGLKAEKRRLEKRLLAIQTAREILIRARENAAARYLGGVESVCARYARVLGNEALSKRLRLLSNGEMVLEENGVFKGSEYYSTGAQDFLDFCVRLALAETLFTREPPVLILDDPFVNFDDEKTESAKRLVQELSNRYQVLYFTCKTERVLE